MKKILLTLAICAFFAPVFASSLIDPVDPVLKATTIRIPVGQAGQTVTLDALAHMKASEYGHLIGHKMNLFDRIGFSIAQRQLRQSINADGTVNRKSLEKLAHMRDGTTGFHFGGFALGFFLGLIGILIAYLINDEKKQNRVKWAWIGFAIGVVILLISLVA